MTEHKVPPTTRQLPGSCRSRTEIGTANSGEVAVKTAARPAPASETLSMKKPVAATEVRPVTTIASRARPRRWRARGRTPVRLAVRNSRALASGVRMALAVGTSTSARAGPSASVEQAQLTDAAAAMPTPTQYARPALDVRAEEVAAGRATRYTPPRVSSTPTAAS